MKRQFILIGIVVVCVIGISVILLLPESDETPSRGWEYFRDMAPTGDEDHGVTYEAFDTNKNFKNKQTSQNSIPKTVPRGFYQKHTWKPLGIPIYEKHNPSETINQSGIYALRPQDITKADELAQKASRTIKNPLPVTPENIQRGKNLHATFCQPCHGSGKTKELGPLAAYTGFSAAQPLSSYAYKAGRFYYTITAGKNAMPSYATQISPDDRWKIVQYIVHELQKRPKKLSPRPSQ